MTRLEEENSVLQALIRVQAFVCLSATQLPDAASNALSCSRPEQLAKWHQAPVLLAAVQAARAGDARELAAAQRREQELTQDNSVLKARSPLLPHQHCDVRLQHAWHMKRSSPC